MNQEPTNVEKLRALPWGIAADSTNTIFAQFTFFGSAFILFLSQLGMNKSQIGFLLSLFPFFGLIAPFIAPRVARFGFKRTFLTFWGTRKIVTLFLLLTPWCLAAFGFKVTLVFVSVIVALFAFCRAVGETGKYPWTQEYIPNAVRGKYLATSSIFTTLAGLLAVSVAGYVIERSSDISSYMFLIAAGVVVGLISVWFFSFLPGGAPIEEGEVDSHNWQKFQDALKDNGFRSYLVGVGLITLATVPMVSFLPLFMREQVGLSDGNVVLLQNGTLVGGLLSGYLLGWAADRYGSKPVMLSGVFSRVFLPIMWIVMPRQTPASLYIALGIAVLQGVANTGWAIGSGRLLFVSIVPREKKSEYMAVYYAWIGLAGGLSQIVGGRILDVSRGISGAFIGISLDPYLPLFLMGLILPLVGWLVFRGAPADSGVSIGEFAGIFLRGNPFQAMGSMFRYYRAKDEHTAVVMTERLSRAGSPLAVEELLEALADPRFHVRFEAIISISRMKPEPRLTAALINLLEGSEVALSVIAAWALGRIGDQKAHQPLREAIHSEYRSIRAHSARALAALGDTEIVPLLLERLATEADKGLKMAYASALGQLGAEEATDSLLSLLAGTNNEGARMELALSLARIVGDEHHFIQLLREVRKDAPTSTSQAMSSIQRKLQKHVTKDDELLVLAEKAALILGQGDLDEGAKLISSMIPLLSREKSSSAGDLILQQCAKRLGDFRALRLEYLIMALHVMAVGRWLDSADREQTSPTGNQDTREDRS